jgi:hypothetical protein
MSSRRYLAVGLAGFVVVLGALVSMPIAVSADSLPTSSHQYATWTPAQSTAASPLVGGAANQTFAPTAAATQFTAKVETQLSNIKQQVGPTFVSAAIDPRVGTLLVIRITGSAASVVSSALAALDGQGTQVRIVENQTPASTLQSEVVSAQAHLGQRVGTSDVLSVALDDLAGKVVVGVDRDAATAQTELVRSIPDVQVVVSKPTSTADGDTWGNNSVRESTPVAGGETVLNPTSGSGCSTALTATRAGGSAVAITAGHCGGVNSNQWELYYSNSQGSGTAPVGPMVASITNPVDEGAISVTNGQYRNCMEQGSGSCLNIQEEVPQLVQGAATTKSGSTTGETSGIIQSINQSFSSSGDNVKNGIAASNQIDHGDSGGALWQQNLDGTVSVIGITDVCASTNTGVCLTGSQAVSYYTNWMTGCQQLGIDATYCPPPFSTPALSLTSGAASTELAVREPDNGLAFFWLPSGSSVWSGPTQVAGPGTTFSAPAMIQDGSSTIITAQGPSNSLDFYYVQNGTQNWAGYQVAGTINEVSSAPSMLLNGSTIQVAAQGPGGSLNFFYVQNGSQTWYGQQVAGTFSTFSAPAMMVDGASTVITAEGFGNSLDFYYQPGTGWVGYQVSGTTNQVFSAPSMLLNGNTIQVATQGPSASLNFFFVQNGSQTWYGQQVAGSSSTFLAPAMMMDGTTTVITTEGTGNSLDFYYQPGTGWLGYQVSVSANQVFSGPSMLLNANTIESSTDGPVAIPIYFSVQNGSTNWTAAQV